jgi:hypothetical protein
MHRFDGLHAFLSRLHPGGQLQRFVMITIRVMAWRERPTSSHVQSERLLRKGLQSRAASQQLLPQLETIPTCEHPIPADPTRAITSVHKYSTCLRPIPVMARPERALPPAHAARATPEKRLAVSSSEPTATSATRNHPDLRASNSGELPPCHHLRTHMAADPFFFLDHQMCYARSLRHHYLSPM